MLDPVQEIKGKLTIEDLVKDYVQLKRAGRNLKGLCPFHQEKSPSFLVSPDKGIAYCFGCHQGGDIFKFYMAIEKVDFPEALNDLAERVGVALEKQDPKFLSAQKEQKNGLKALLKETTLYFQAQLKSTPKAQQYLTERGLNPETIARFSLGYAPEGWHGLSEHLTKKGFSTAELVAAGVAISDEQNVKKVHDKFRDRIIFPFFNERGDIIGFTGRALSKENEPKYLNSPETVLFHKSSFIYGLYQAKESIRKLSEVIVVEGQVDCLQAAQNGYPNTVAVSGTAFTEQHLEMLRRLANRIIFTFDGDKAGKNATLRILPDLLKQAIPCAFVNLPDEQDPDSLLRSQPQLFAQLIKQPIDWLSFIEQALFAQQSLKEAETAKQFIELCLPLIKKLQQPYDQEEALKRLAMLTGKSPHVLHKSLQRTRLESRAKPALPSTQTQQDLIFYTLAFYCQFHQFIQDLIDPSLHVLLTPEEQNIYRTAHAYYSEARNSLDISTLVESLHIPQDVFSLLLLQIEERYSAYTAEKLELEKNALLKRVKDTLKRKKLLQLKQKLEQAKRENDKETEKKILAESAQFLKYT